MTGSCHSVPALTAGRFLAVTLLLGLSATVAGCASTSARNELLRIDGSDGVYARGHSVSAKMIGGRLYYRMQSVLGGKEAALACRHSEAVSVDGLLAVSLKNCLPGGGDGLNAASLLPPLEQAQTELHTYFAGVAATQVAIVALPFGTRHYNSQRGWRNPEALALKFAVWWNDEGDISLREAVRSFSHEFTHLAVKAKRMQVSREDGEMLASTFENCIEFAVFGDISIDPDDVGDEILLERVKSESLRKSIAGSRAANNEIHDWLRENNLDDIRQRCRETLESM